ncbi:hypothetical protein [Sphingomonas immobilis]|uniref:L,D-transpeptidase n=1 Tax=Sphingomonas immobilis TaxID=3063997 RepID=A0ABT9A0I5_9SPHN|nr:hypothetical protein [Sphingomonas sp. CA1-15]MDO7843345.1 hypothetical protein [Sphingomonas sp. CA1-15]
MIHVLLALAGLALATPAAERPRTTSPKPAPVAAARDGTAILPSAEALRVADWVAASGDNRALPYAIVDKKNAALFLFDAKAKPIAVVPVLIGVAVGDDASPGIGSKKLAEIGPAEKTTPAGRFLAKFGLAFGKERILWVDYATSVALHPIPPDSKKKDRRRERMLSPTPDDNRITFGCINVPKVFYGTKLRPLFQRRGGYVYVLPDTKPLEAVFPRLRVAALVNGDAAPE